MRARLAEPLPCHVTLKVRRGLPSLRTVKVVRELERSFTAACQRASFRLVQYSIQNDHLHAIVEATSERDLASGMKAIGARLARAVNRIFRRRGSVLADRYHLHVLRTPHEVRNALAYVLLNRGDISRETGTPPARAACARSSVLRTLVLRLESKIPTGLFSIPRPSRRRTRGSCASAGGATERSILARCPVRRGACLVLLSLATFATPAFAHRYSENRDDWVGPRNADFDADFAACRARMDAQPFRYGGDPRLIFLDCMEKRGWHLKGRS